MTILDRILLAVTGIVALYLVDHFRRNRSYGAAAQAAYMVSFGVLLVAGLLLIIFGYGALASPMVVIAGALIPVGLSLGLVSQFSPAAAKGYLAWSVIGVLGIAVTRFVGPSGLATAVLALVHSVAGLIILLAPLRAAAAGRVPKAFSFITLGGALISVGGVALAFLKAGRPILPADFIFAILAPLLLLMTASFAWGFVRGAAPAPSVEANRPGSTHTA